MSGAQTILLHLYRGIILNGNNFVMDEDFMEWRDRVEK